MVKSNLPCHSTQVSNAATAVSVSQEHLQSCVLHLLLAKFSNEQSDMMQRIKLLPLVAA
jgi:hypothetical protein